MKKGLELKSIASWLNVNKPVIISGPCSAETEEQMVATAKQIAATGKVHALRAGIWKPRTRPGQYEGAGDVGLQWLMTAKKETGSKAIGSTDTRSASLGSHAEVMDGSDPGVLRTSGCEGVASQSSPGKPTLISRIRDRGSSFRTSVRKVCCAVWTVLGLLAFVSGTFGP